MPPDPKVAKGLREFGFNFVQGYGLTETSPILTLNQIDNENTAIFQGYKLTEPDFIEWIASNSPNHGDRRHDLMNGKRVEPGKYFVTHLGNKIRYPGDPEGPIKETANCGCAHVAIYKDIEEVKQKIKEDKMKASKK